MNRLHAVAAALIAAHGGALAQAPDGAVFRPLAGDPREPQFFAAYLWERSPRLAPRLGSVGLGQTVGLVRAADWQLSIAAGVFSQFNMGSPTNDLINTDYIVGLPFAYRRDAVTLRLRVYHQSSHLGDEYLLHTQAQRVDLTFEAAELLVSNEIAAWRVYGGGEYIFARSPPDLRPGVLHGGLEYRQRGTLVRVGRLAVARLVAALDGRSVQDRNWQVGWSAVTGLEVGGSTTAPGSGPRWSVLLKAYSGPSPYGEFYRDRVSSLGVGVGLTL